MEKEKLFIAALINLIARKALRINVEVIPISQEDLTSIFEDQSKKMGAQFHSIGELNLKKQIFMYSFTKTITEKSFDLQENQIEKEFMEIEKQTEIPHQLRMGCYIWFKIGHDVAKNHDKYTLLWFLCNDIARTLKLTPKTSGIPSQIELQEKFKMIDRSLLDEIDIDKNINHETCALVSFYAGYLASLNNNYIIYDENGDVYEKFFKKIMIPALKEIECDESTYLDYFECFKYGYEQAILS